MIVIVAFAAVGRARAERGAELRAGRAPHSARLGGGGLARQFLQERRDVLVEELWGGALLDAVFLLIGVVVHFIGVVVDFFVVVIIRALRVDGGGEAEHGKGGCNARRMLWSRFKLAPSPTKNDSWTQQAL